MIFPRFGIVGAAREDARARLDSAEDRIVADLGPKPALDTVNNPEHARLVSALDRVRIEETREDLVRAEDAGERHASPWLVTLGLAVAVVIEAVGAILITRALGLPPAERLPLGLALAIGVIGLTAVTANRTSATRPAGESDEARGANLATVAKRSIASLVICAAYAVFVVALVVVRLRNAGSDDATEIETLAEAALMLATTLGPAWAAEWLIRLRAPAVAVVKRIRSLKHRLREAERSRTQAQATIERIAREGVRWEAEAARRRAKYRTEHRLEAVRVEREIQESE